MSLRRRTITECYVAGTIFRKKSFWHFIGLFTVRRLLNSNENYILLNDIFYVFF